jgi:hypothetical protein
MVGLATKYRNSARQHFENAEALLDKKDQNSVRYACLELRMSLESICYGLLYNFRDELSKGGVAKWQPKKVLAELLEVDKYITTTQTLSIQDPETKEWLELGGPDHRFSAAWANKAHNALGNTLHAPTITQLATETLASDEAIRDRCRTYLSELKTIVESQSWHVRFVGPRWKMKCQCGFEMHRRKEHVIVGTVIICSDCGRTYDVEAADDASVRAELRKLRWNCLQCGELNGTPQIELVENGLTKCRKCNEPAQIQRNWGVFQRNAGEKVGV